MCKPSPAFTQKPHRITDRPYWLGHIPFVIWLIEQSKPAIIVELGTETGVSLSAMCQAVDTLNLSSAIFAIDTWKGDINTGLYDATVYAELRAYLEEKHYNFVTMIRSTFDDALNKFEDGSIDLLHIDGCHTYEAVSHDFEMWRPKLSNRGVVLLHDISVKKNDFGVWRFWKTARRVFPSFGFYHSFGLGVLLVGEDQSAALCQLSGSAHPGAISFSSAEAKAVFETLGTGIIETSALNSAVHANQEALTKAEAIATDLRAEIVERDSAVHANQQALAKAEAIVADLRAEIVERDSAVHANQQALGKAEAIVADLRAEIVQRDSAVHANQRAIAKAEAIVANLQAEIAQRDAAVRDYQAAVAHAHGLIGDRDNALHELKSITAEQRIALARSQARLEEQRSYIMAREAQLREEIKHISTLLNEAVIGSAAENAAKEEIHWIASHRLALLRVERSTRLETEGSLLEERNMRIELERSFKAEQEMRMEAERAFFAITRSTTWRATGPLRALLSHFPRLRLWARSTAQNIGRLILRNHWLAKRIQ